MPKQWIAKVVSKHKDAPAKKMAKAAKSSNPRLRQQINMSRTLSGLRK